MSESNVLKRSFGPRNSARVKNGKKLHNEEFNFLYDSPYIRLKITWKKYYNVFIIIIIIIVVITG
jgi:hypothetical protein